MSTNELALQTAQELADELNKFRTEWKRELNETTRASTTKETTIERQQRAGRKQVETGVLRPRATGASIKLETTTTESTNEEPAAAKESEEDKAMYLFGKGVLLEQQGRHYEAIQFYRMSMQLDPDIEFKMDAGTVSNSSKEKSNKQQQATAKAAKPTTNQVLIVEDLTDERENATSANDDQSGDEEDSLLKQFQQMAIAENRYCEKSVPQKATHFSQLPSEVIMLIFKWAVSDQLDMRTLESLSMVCKGFYVCARDPEIWRLACLK